jgi:hypothetical protein
LEGFQTEKCEVINDHLYNTRLSLIVNHREDYMEPFCPDIRAGDVTSWHESRSHPETKG